MRQHTLFRETLLSLKRTRARFLSIIAIVALGTGFFTGLQVTPYDMKWTAREFFNAQQLMDVRVISSIGLDEKDMALLSALPGVKSVMPSYTLDLFASLDAQPIVVRAGSFRPDGLNLPVLTEGRMPRAANECLIEQNKATDGAFALGDTLTLSPPEDQALEDLLRTDTFTIVGFAQSPQYISVNRGPSPIGSGEVKALVFLPEAAYQLPVYTDAYLTLLDTAENLPDAAAYRDKVDTAIQNLEPMLLQSVRARLEAELADARLELDKAQDELNAQRLTAERELADTRKQLEDSHLKLTQGQEAYDTQLAAFESGISDGQAQLDEQRLMLIAQQDALSAAFGVQNTLVLLINQPPQTLTAQQTQAIAASAQFDSNLPTMLGAYLENPSEAQKATLQAITQGIAIRLSTQQDALTAGQSQLARAQAALDTQKEEGAAQLSSAKEALDEGFKAYHEGYAAFSDAETESLAKLADGQQELDTARADIDDVATPTLTVLDRWSNPGYGEFMEDADRVTAVARIFPVFFLLVASLVCLTTMTRMVEEERTQIGTLKALGYSPLAIAGKYLFYAGTASLIGSLVGVSLGFVVFPLVIYRAYDLLYTMPDLVLVYRWDFLIFCALVALGASLGCVLLACRHALSEQAAALMRPKAPLPGKRVLLERIPFIWNKLNFTLKITLRNLFLRKAHLMMTIIGVGGCTALLLAGFGLKDSIVSIAPLQYGEILRYDAIVVAKDDGQEALLNALLAQNDIESFLLLEQKSLTASNGNIHKQTYLSVPADMDALSDFVTLRERETQTPLAMPDSGVIITEKLARLLGVTSGQSITLDRGLGNTVNVTVSGIAENYAMHFIYMPPALYQTLFDQPPAYTMAFANLAPDADEDALAARLISHDGIVATSFASSTQNLFDDMVTSLNSIVYVLILCAGALALIVLYSLTTIHVNERIREIATIKVLGFYDGEVSRYISLEGLFASLMGLAAGLLGGIALHRFVIIQAEVDLVMFGRAIHPQSYLFAALLTILFQLIVDAYFHFHLKKVNMVESLKAVE